MTSSKESSKQVRVAIAGLGGHGGTIQNACDKAANLNVVAVFDTDEELATQAANRFDCYQALSYEEMIRREDIDAVVLVTPNYLHKKQVMGALENDLHVFVEKPIALTLDEGMAMVSKAEMKGQVLMVGHNMRYWPTARKAKNWLQEGHLGQVISVEIHFSSPSGMRLPLDSWRRKPELCPILPITQLAIHGFDLVHYLIGFIDEVTTYTRSALTNDEVIDSSSAIFRLDNGVLGSMISNYCSRELFELRISGTKGTVRLRPDSFWFKELSLAGEDDKLAIEELDKTKGFESYDLIMESFGKAVLEYSLPETDGWVGLQALAVVDAMQRSAGASATPWKVERFQSARR